MREDRQADITKNTNVSKSTTFTKPVSSANHVPENSYECSPSTFFELFESLYMYVCSAELMIFVPC